MSDLVLYFLKSLWFNKRFGCHTSCFRGSLQRNYGPTDGKGKTFENLGKGFRDPQISSDHILRTAGGAFAWLPATGAYMISSDSLTTM